LSHDFIRLCGRVRGIHTHGGWEQGYEHVGQLARVERRMSLSRGHQSPWPVGAMDSPCAVQCEVLDPLF